MHQTDIPLHDSTPHSKRTVEMHPVRLPRVAGIGQHGMLAGEREVGRQQENSWATQQERARARVGGGGGGGKA